MSLRLAGVGLGALLLLATLVAASGEPVPPPSITQEGVSYFWSVGTVASGHLQNRGDDTGVVPFDFLGCAYAKLRPETTGGRIHVQGIVNGRNRLDADISEFDAPNQQTPGIMPNITLDG